MQRSTLTKTVRTKLRQMLLFLGAIVAPFAVLLWLGVRTMRQDEELATNRAAQDQRNAVALAKRELQTSLEKIEARASTGRVGPLDPEIAFIAEMQRDRLIPPWTKPPRNADATRSAQEDLLAASKMLREGNPAAAAIATRLLGQPADVRDEYDIPFAVYASKSLAGALPREASERIAKLPDEHWLPPAALYMIADLPMIDAQRRERIRARAAELEAADGLAAQISRFERSGAQWLTFADDAWLVRIVERPQPARGLLIAVRTRQVLDSVLLPGKSEWMVGNNDAGEPLGAEFPDLGLALHLPASAPAPRSRFYAAAAILLSLTLFSAWLLYRDFGRETRLARLHAQFVSSVSHELRTPIASIRAYAELMEMGRARNPEEASEYVKTIIGESERLTRLVESVLEFSKLEQGKRLYRFGSVSLEQVLRSAAKAVAYPLDQGAFRLSMKIDTLPPVQADSEALEQAVVNLLNNAIKYSGESREIDLSLRREGPLAVIRVRDEGLGIAPEEQARIFESFYRAPLPDGRHVSGTGLGLTLVDHIVKAHKGRVEVESQPGHGSTFSILIPVEAEA